MPADASEPEATTTYAIQHCDPREQMWHQGICEYPSHAKAKATMEAHAKAIARNGHNFEFRLVKITTEVCDE